MSIKFTNNCQVHLTASSFESYSSINQTSFLNIVTISYRIFLEENVESFGDITLSATTAASRLKKSRSNSGEVTACYDLNHFNISRRNKQVSFYVMPRIPEVKKWLQKISRKTSISYSSHRVWSAHFDGVAKTYMNIALTIFPKAMKLETPKPRNSRNSGVERQNFSFSVAVLIMMKTWKLVVLS